MGAKKISLWVIIVSVVWVLALTVARALVPVFSGTQLGLAVPEIIAGGVFFVVAFTPVYRSIWLDKKLGITDPGTGGDAQHVSLWVIVFAVAWVFGVSLVKAFYPFWGFGTFGLSIYEIIGVGVFLVVAFTPVYRSIWLDKKLSVQGVERPAVRTAGSEVQG